MIKSLYEDRTTDNEPIPLIKMIPEDIEILNIWLEFQIEPDCEITSKDFIFLDYDFKHLDLFEQLSAKELFRIMNFAFANQILLLLESCAKVLSQSKLEFIKTNISVRDKYGGITTQKTDCIKVFKKDYRNRVIKTEICPIDKNLSMIILKYKPVKTIIKQDDELLKMFKYNPTFDRCYDFLFSVETNYVEKFTDIYESPYPFVLKKGSTSQLQDPRVKDIVHQYISEEDIPRDVVEFNVPTTMSGVNAYAFENCVNLHQIILGDRITVLGDSCFKNCSSLVNINMPPNLLAICHSSFKDCRSLTSLTLPNSIKYVMNEAFENCTSLTNIVIPDTIEHIGQRAFRNTNLNDEVKTQLLNKYSQEIF